MTDDEATLAHRALTNTLKENHLDWVVEQVSRQIRLGRPTRKRVALQEGWQLESGRRRARTEFVSTVPYSHKEQLKLLVDALDHAVVSTAEMESFILKTLGEGLEPLAIKFVPEGASEGSYAIDPNQVQDRITVASQLRNLLDEIRNELPTVD